MTRMIWRLAALVVLVLGNVAAGAQPPQETWCGATQAEVSREEPSQAVDPIERKITQRMDCPISFNYKDTPLCQIIEDLSVLCGVNVVRDVDALPREGILLCTPLTLRVDNMPMRAALNMLLKKLDLAYVIKDQALYITFPHMALPKLKTVVYQVADLIVPMTNGPSLVCCQLAEKCRSYSKPNDTCVAPKTCESALIQLILNIEPASWREMGGCGTIQFFPLGMSLTICQTQDIHTQIRELLKQVRHFQNIQDTEFQLTMTMVTITADGKRKEEGWPKVTFIRDQLIQLSVGTQVSLKEGTVRDFICNEGNYDIVQASRSEKCKDQLAPLHVGRSFQFKLTGPVDGPLSLDMTLQNNELEEANKDGIMVAGKTYRMLRKVTPGQRFKMVLERDDQGDARRWLECTVARPTTCFEWQESATFGPPLLKW